MAKTSMPAAQTGPASALGSWGVLFGGCGAVAGAVLGGAIAGSAPLGLGFGILMFSVPGAILGAIVNLAIGQFASPRIGRGVAFFIGVALGTYLAAAFIDGLLMKGT